MLELLGSAQSEPLLVPFDWSDGVLGAYWQRLEAFLDSSVQLSNSGMALLDPDVVQRSMERLEDDLGTGAWHRQYGDLLDKTELDLGYRLVIAGST